MSYTRDNILIGQVTGRNLQDLLKKGLIQPLESIENVLDDFKGLSYADAEYIFERSKHLVRLSLEQSLSTPGDEISTIGLHVAPIYFTMNIDEVHQKYIHTPFLIKNDNMVLRPNSVIISFSLERIMLPSGYKAMIFPKTRIGRLCIRVSELPYVDIGYKGIISYQITNPHPFPISISIDNPVCDMFIERVRDQIEYHGHYEDTLSPASPIANDAIIAELVIAKRMADKERENDDKRRLSRMNWKIAITSAILGALSTKLLDKHDAISKWLREIFK